MTARSAQSEPTLERKGEASGSLQAGVGDRLWAHGFAHLGDVLSRAECDALRGCYDDDKRFRSTIDMARYRFGRGQYRYFAYPLPPEVQRLRTQWYRTLVPVARRWTQALGIEAGYPDNFAEFRKLCHAKGQYRPTPLLLRYREGDFNCLHQDIYGPVAFPFQVIVSLSAPEREFDGGELMLVEQRPRAQSIGLCLRLNKGEGVVITTRWRPVSGTRGFYRSNFRHGVSEVTRGERFTLGIIFHDAE